MAVLNPVKLLTIKTDDEKKLFDSEWCKVISLLKKFTTQGIIRNLKDIGGIETEEEFQIYEVLGFELRMGIHSVKCRIPTENNKFIEGRFHSSSWVNYLVTICKVLGEDLFKDWVKYNDLGHYILSFADDAKSPAFSITYENKLIISELLYDLYEIMKFQPVLDIAISSFVWRGGAGDRLDKFKTSLQDFERQFQNWIKEAQPYLHPEFKIM